MRRKKEHHEEHVDETWLIPYADMLTLLLALFIVMFAMSKVDAEKLAKASKEFNTIFSGGQAIIGEGSSGNGEVSVLPSNSEIEETKMNEIKGNLEKEIESQGYGDKVKVGLGKEGLTIDIQDVVLFDSGKADVSNRINPLLIEISKMLHGLGNNIRVIGHTDNIQISNAKFRSNWDLSAMRAINVMNFLSKEGNIPQKQLSIQAYAEYMPKFDNSTEEGRAKNRRVEIVIVREYQEGNDGEKNK